MIKTLKKSLAVLALASLVSVSSAPAQAEASKEKLPAREWSFNGMFGTFDRASLQRGLQVYQEVCAACHSLRLVAYRNLAAIGLSEETDAVVIVVSEETSRVSVARHGRRMGANSRWSF